MRRSRKDDCKAVTLTILFDKVDLKEKHHQSGEECGKTLLAVEARFFCVHKNWAEKDMKGNYQP